jgi:hypothetical protein
MKGMQNVYKTLVGKFEGRNYLGYIGVEVRIISSKGNNI